jgi:hypothetical protein
VDCATGSDGRVWRVWLLQLRRGGLYIHHTVNFYIKLYP